jgi:hypothetical protein
MSSTHKPQRPKRIIFVGGLPATTTEGEVHQYFSRFAQIAKVEIVRHRKAKISKGYAYIKLEHGEEARGILAVTHYIDGRKVDCQLAANRKEKKGCKEDQNKRMVYIKNLPEDLTSEELLAHFKQCSRVRNAYVIYDCETKKSKKFGYVEFLTFEDAVYFHDRDVLISSAKVKCLAYSGRRQKAAGSSENHLTGDQTLSGLSNSHASREDFVEHEEGQPCSNADDRAENSPNKHHKYEYLLAGTKKNEHMTNYRLNVGYCIPLATKADLFGPAGSGLIAQSPPLRGPHAGQADTDGLARSRLPIRCDYFLPHKIFYLTRPAPPCSSSKLLGAN